MLLPLLLACASETTDAGLTGSIDFADIGEVGVVEGLSAYGLAQDGKLIAYISSAPDVTCAQMVTHLTPGDNTDDPTGVFRDGHCNIFMALPDYSDGLSATDDALAIAGMSITCTLGEGEFVFEERDTGDEDYYWSGRYWQGNAESYDLNITPADGGYDFSMEMDGFSGNLIYEGLVEYAGTGVVSGVQTITECADFAALHAVY